MSVPLTAPTRVLLKEFERLRAATKGHKPLCRCGRCRKLQKVYEVLAAREAAAQAMR